MENQPPAPNEGRFRQLLAEAGKQRGRFDRRLERIAGQKFLSRDELPEHLLIGLSYLASIQHRAILLLLSDGLTSYAAEIQSRGLLEFLAHVAFVLGKETDAPVGTARQRAICLSLARAREEYQTMRSAEDLGKVEAGTAAGALERVDLYNGLHRREGCPWGSRPWACVVAGKPCKHRSQWPCRDGQNPRPRTMVKYTLELLSDRIAAPWLVDLYVTSSLLAHQGLLDRIVQPVDGIDTPSAATYRHRATVLSAALSAYGQGLGWILEHYSSTAAHELSNEWGVIYDLPDYAAAASGEWDSPATRS
ncbi:MAG TPA: hypothetical protein VHK65_13900 [Candidatus Dormibacteraeota bacterium]|nr:hypothetical protein [Candidatus Dormibacteraeota bacterium]